MLIVALPVMEVRVVWLLMVVVAMAILAAL
jgi:hypothetical protein